VNHRVFIVLLTFVFPPALHANEDWLGQLDNALQATLGGLVTKMADQMVLDNYHYEIDLHYLDTRLNLPACQKDLTITPPEPLKLGRNHIKVNCPKPRNWAINVPVEIKLFAPVVVLNQPVNKGLILKETHLEVKTHNLAQLRYGYFLKKELVIGKQSKKSLAGHTVINSNHILPPLLVRKGDHVMIEASKGAMSVKMPGEALSDGREGRQIRVKNNRSQRIIRAQVVAAGIVKVLF
jgi:flagella basal body P-ring formation protein FlgA